jgi:hypothetical protein
MCGLLVVILWAGIFRPQYHLGRVSIASLIALVVMEAANAAYIEFFPYW